MPASLNPSQTLPKGRIVDVLRAMPFISDKATARSIGISPSSLSNYIGAAVRAGWARRTAVVSVNGQPSNRVECIITLPDGRTPSPPPSLSAIETAAKRECLDVLTTAGVSQLQGILRALYLTILSLIERQPQFRGSKGTAAQLNLKPAQLLHLIARAERFDLIVTTGDRSHVWRCGHSITEKGRLTLAAARRLKQLL